MFNRKKSMAITIQYNTIHFPVLITNDSSVHNSSKKKKLYNYNYSKSETTFLPADVIKAA